MSEIILNEQDSSSKLVELDKETILDIIKESLEERYTINGLLKHIYNNFNDININIENKEKYRNCLIDIRNKLELSELKKVYIVECDSSDKAQEELERIKAHYLGLKYENSVIEFYRVKDLTTIEGCAKLEKDIENNIEDDIVELTINKNTTEINEYFYTKIKNGEVVVNDNLSFKNFCYHVVKNPFVQNEIGEYETTTGKIYGLLTEFIKALDVEETKESITKYLQTKYYTKLLDRYREKEINEETNLRKSKLEDFITFTADREKISTKDDFTTNKIELYPYEKLNGKGGKIGNPRVFYDNIKQTKFIDKTLITNTLPFKLHSIKNDGEVTFEIKGLNRSKIPEKEAVVKPIFTNNTSNISSDQLRELQKEYYGIIDKNKYLTINIGSNDINFNNNNEAIDGYLIIDKRQHLKDNKITKTYKKSNTGVALDSKINSLFDDRDFVVCHKFFNDGDNGNKTIIISHSHTEGEAVTGTVFKRWENLATLRKDEYGFYLKIANRTVKNNHKTNFLNWIEPSSLKQIKFVRTNKFTFDKNDDQVINEFSELDYNKDQILFNVEKVKLPSTYYNYYKIYLKENIFDLNKIINEKVYITEFLQYGNFTTNYRLSIPDDPDLREILRYNKITTSFHDKVFEMSADSFDVEYNEKSLNFVGDGSAFYVGTVNGNTCTLYTTNQESTNQFCRIICNASIEIEPNNLDPLQGMTRG